MEGGGDVNGAHSKDTILHAALFHLHSSLSCRGLKEIMADRGVMADHVTPG